MTPEGMGETSPLSKANILCAFPDDDEAGDRMERGEPSVVPMRDRSACSPGMLLLFRRRPELLLAQLPLLFLLSGAGAPAAQVAKLSGFKLTKRRVDYATMDK